MKRIVSIYSACVIVAVLLSLPFPTFLIRESAVNALYTVAGIMFSIGLSLTVISNTSGIKNRDIKQRIRREIKATRNHFIYSFLFASLAYFLYLIVPPLNCAFLNRSWAMVLIQGVSIAYFVYNFIALQRFNEQIEDATS